jgi:hypothetical protein
MSGGVRMIGGVIAITQEMLDDYKAVHDVYAEMFPAMIRDALDEIEHGPKHGPPLPPRYGPPAPDWCHECGAVSPGYGRTA